MDKVWDHIKNEKPIYKMWESLGSFTPKADKNKKPFCIIMPPPNANENLHIGHVRFITIEDILIRYYRMRGFSSLWLPGADHAGIETQYVFEKKLKEKGKSRFDFERKELYTMIWDYVQENRKKMEEQLRSLGASCDWTRSKFTLDSDIVNIVNRTFEKLHKSGYVYRGERIVNYCPRCGTAFSQLEVDYVEKKDHLYFLDYKTLKIATTRPETIFADTAVAVNPKDVRYKNLVGKMAIVPIINREIPVIADDSVDTSFGTGALKVTPGHDPLDFEIGQRHNLAVISVIDLNGKMINAPKEYLGLDVNSAREKVVEDLDKSLLLIKKEPIKHMVGTCYRDKGVLEPVISKQWFIKTKDIAKKAAKAITNKDVTFYSKQYEKMALHWLNNLKDWNISRQIVWGIQIPAWKCECGEWTITDGKVPKKCSYCKSNKLIRDRDTFDTWFSSAQWPFATLMTTRKDDFKYFYPTSIMETGYDIIPFWVIRMIMLGIFSTGKIPFQKVLTHGLVRDSSGLKISKSKGNVINPLEMVDKYGADALRVGLIWGAGVDNDISLSENNIRGQRNFANKIWNIARFTDLMSKNKKVVAGAIDDENDRWIKKELKKTINEVEIKIENAKLNEAIEIIYDFIWKKFADVYIEKLKNKEEINLTIFEVLKTSLVILHPFMPFVTESLYQKLYSKSDKDILIHQNWPH